MTNFENIKKMSVIGLAKWLDKYGIFDDAPWVKQFEETYCKKCKPENDAAWCEFHNDECKFFQRSISTEEIIEMWLRSQCE